MIKTICCALSAALLCVLFAACGVPDNAIVSHSVQESPPASFASGFAQPDSHTVANSAGASSVSGASEAASSGAASPASGTATGGGSPQSSAPAAPSKGADAGVVQPDAWLLDALTPVTREALNFRKGPGTQYASMLVIPKGDKVKEVGYCAGNTGWAFVKYDGKQGWVSIEWLSYANEEIVAPDIRYDQETIRLTTTEALNFRRGPGTDYVSILVIPKGATVRKAGSIPSIGGWVLVEYMGKQGWSAAEWLS